MEEFGIVAEKVLVAGISRGTFIYFHTKTYVGYLERKHEN